VSGGGLAPLRDRRFRLLFAGRSVSMLGSSMAPVALAFAVLEISDSAAVLGIVLAARSIPMAGFMLLGGVVADRFSRSLVLQVSHLLSALTQGAVASLLLTALPMLVLGTDPQVVPLVLLAFAAGAGMEVFGIGWTTALQEHVPEEVLSRVFAYDALGSFVAIPVGQLLAGPLAQWLGAPEVAVAGGVLLALVTAATLLSPSVRDLESVAAREPASA
jgi:MFS family permease